MGSNLFDDDQDVVGPDDVDSDLFAEESGAQDDDTRPCPGCGRDVHWDAPRCPHCGHWIAAGASSSPAAHRAAGWFWPVMVAILIAIILVIWHGLR